MTPEIATAVATAVTMFALTLLGFRGNLVVLARELVAAQKHFDEQMDQEREHFAARIADKDSEIHRLRESLEETRSELKGQYSVNADMAREVFTTTRFLQSLSGLAQSDRRRTDGS